MNPKEKAEQLLSKMFNTGSALYAERIRAKQCALIAVDEIINTIEQIFETFEERKYWNEVKNEINNL